MVYLLLKDDRRAFWMLVNVVFFVVEQVGIFRFDGFKLYEWRDSLQFLDVIDLFCTVDTCNTGLLNGVTKEENVCDAGRLNEVAEDEFDVCNGGRLNGV